MFDIIGLSQVNYCLSPPYVEAFLIHSVHCEVIEMDKRNQLQTGTSEILVVNITYLSSSQTGFYFSIVEK